MLHPTKTTNDKSVLSKNHDSICKLATDEFSSVTLRSLSALVQHQAQNVPRKWSLTRNQIRLRAWHYFCLLSSPHCGRNEWINSHNTTGRCCTGNVLCFRVVCQTTRPLLYILLSCVLQPINPNVSIDVQTKRNLILFHNTRNTGWYVGEWGRKSANVTKYKVNQPLNI